MMSFMQDSRRVQSQRLHNELRVRLQRPTVAAILSWQARLDAIAAGVTAAPFVSIYETQGLLVLG